MKPFGDMCGMMAPDEVSGTEAWRVYDHSNPTVPDDISRDTTTDCWAFDQKEMRGHWRPMDKACKNDHVWECRESAASDFCNLYKPETSLGYLAWKMLPFWAHEVKFESPDSDNVDVVDGGKVIHTNNFEEPSYEEMMGLF